MSCGPCEGTGFVNLHQVSSQDLDAAEHSPDGFIAAMQRWMEAHEDHDVAVCGCCGDGRGGWPDWPGEHDEARFADRGLPECF